MITRIEFDQIDLIELLESYDLELFVTSTQNANFNCPFHGEKNPSCGMQLKNGLWKCFACGVSGNLVSFVAEMDQTSLKTAEEKIRRKWINKLTDPETIITEVDAILATKEEIIGEEPRYPNWILSQYSNDYTYLNGRGITNETCKYFNVVYDPKTKYQGFPCFDSVEKLVGITGRNTQDGEPRYFPLLRFKKSQFVYNFHNIDRNKPIIAVEGEINVLAMHQAGYSNTIAFLGAGVSNNQINIIKNCGAKELIIFFDSDGAGNHGKKLLFQSLWLYMKIKSVKDHQGDAADMTKEQIDLLLDSTEELTVEL